MLMMKHRSATCIRHGRSICTSPGIVFAFLTLWLTASTVPAAPPVKQPTLEPVRVPDCRLLLIDQVLLASELTGVLKSVAAEEGTPVEKGQEVARLRDTIAAAALATAEQRAGDRTAVRYARKASELADVEHRKMQDLYQREVVTELEYRRARLEAERAALQIEQSENELITSRLERDERQAQLGAYRIEAPFSGVVSRVLRRPGEAVREGDPILELVSTRRLRVEGYVDVLSADGIRRGSRVEVFLPRDGQLSGRPATQQPGSSAPTEAPERFTGRIMFVDLSVEPNTQTVRVQAEVTGHGDRLRAGLTARMLVYPDRAEKDNAGVGQAASRENRP